MAGGTCVCTEAWAGERCADRKEGMEGGRESAELKDVQTCHFPSNSPCSILQPSV